MMKLFGQDIAQLLYDGFKDKLVPVTVQYVTYTDAADPLANQTETITTATTEGFIEVALDRFNKSYKEVRTHKISILLKPLPAIPKAQDKVIIGSRTYTILQNGTMDPAEALLVVDCNSF